METMSEEYNKLSLLYKWGKLHAGCTVRKKRERLEQIEFMSILVYLFKLQTRDLEKPKNSMDLYFNYVIIQLTPHHQAVACMDWCLILHVAEMLLQEKLLCDYLVVVVLVGSDVESRRAAAGWKLRCRQYGTLPPSSVFLLELPWRWRTKAPMLPPVR